MTCLHQSHKRWRVAGFTLLEMLIALAILAVLIALAVPALESVIRNNRRSAQLVNFVAALHYARSEAVKRGERITLCKSSDALTADPPSCNRDNTLYWEIGWIVFVDLDADGRRDGGETVLRVYPPLKGGNTLRGKSNIKNYFSYKPIGTGNTAGTFTLCDARGAASARAVILARTGRARISETASGGGALTCP